MADGGTRHQFANYDKRLISILEVVGSHFVDIYFNHVYNSSQTKLKAGGSLTDEYTRQIRAYITGVKTDEQLYRTVIQGLHRYFQNATRFSALSFTDFVERIVSQFIPPEYYGQFKTQEKDETLGSIVADLVSGLGVYISSSDMLRRVIDEHNLNTNVTIRMLQDQAITILLNKRGRSTTASCGGSARRRTRCRWRSSTSSRRRSGSWSGTRQNSRPSSARPRSGRWSSRTR